MRGLGSLVSLRLLFPSQRLVALLGIAYRHISVKFTQKTKKPSQPKPLPASVKTIGDWIQVKLQEHGMAPYHLAFKMGIASTLVNAWKDGKAQPKAHHIREMVRLLGKYCRLSNHEAAGCAAGTGA
jgi:ribosome-binding protein aMBF1 (putative translation factor)